MVIVSFGTVSQKLRWPPQSSSSDEMNRKHFFIVLPILLLVVGCGRYSPSTIVEGEPAQLVDKLIPPVSKGKHTLKVSPMARDSIWLFGAYNNGRLEENVLVEELQDSIRLRAWWMIPSGGMWCIDKEIAENDLRSLWSALERQNVFDLPNMVPDVSHAMTYWVKVKKDRRAHEACVYAIELLHDEDFDIFRRDKKVALKWSAVVNAVLNMRNNHKSEIRPAEFDEKGHVNWNLEMKNEFDASNAL